MEVLTTYVRMHAPLMKKTHVEGSGSNDATPRSNNANPPHNVPAAAPSPDIQAILTVIGRRELKFEKGTIEPLDLHSTNLANATLFNANLFNANLDGAELFGAYLKGAYLGGAWLSDTHGLTQNQINSTLGNEKPMLPPDIHMPYGSPKPSQPTK